MADLALSGTPGKLAVGAIFSFTPTVEGSDGTAITYTADSLPDGATLDAATGVISGTPTTAGEVATVLTATQSDKTATLDVNFTVAQKLTLSGSMPNGAVGDDYTFDAAATVLGGDGSAIAWSEEGLPEGLTIDAATGAVSGKPASSGEMTITITAVQNGVTARLVDQIEIDAVLTLGGSPTSATVGVAYEFDVLATGGIEGSPVAYAVTDLPAGLSIDAASGKVTGTPTTEGVATFTVTATQGDVTASQVFTITVNPALSVTGTPGALSIGTLFAFTPTVLGGDGTAITWSAKSLPDGLNINPTTGAISGTPTTAGAVSATITAKQSGASANAVMQFIVSAKLSITGTAPVGYVGVPYTFTPTVTYNGSATLSYTADNLPEGLTIDAASGTISGTPTNGVAGDSSIVVTDGAVTATLDFSLSVAPPVSLSGNPVTAVVGRTYQFLPTVSNVNEQSTTLEVTVTEGELPDGLSLNPSTGAITGTPTTAGTATFTLSVTDHHTSSAAQFVITTEVRLSVDPYIDPATLGADYSGKINVFGLGTDTPATFTIISDNLPSGLTLEPATGAITGNPLQEGAFQLQVRVETEDQTFYGPVYFQVQLLSGEDTVAADQIILNARLKLVIQNMDSGSSPTDAQVSAAALALTDATVLIQRRCITPLADDAMTAIMSNPNAFSPAAIALMSPLVASPLRRTVTTLWTQYYTAAFDKVTPVNAPAIIRDFRRSFMVSYLMKAQVANRAAV